MKDKTKKVIFAAGGLVWRETPAGRQLAVIYRPKYRDWSLPKGKLKKDETFEKAAIREVKEEMGFAVNITDFAGVLNYRVKGIPKVVVFWNMKLMGKGTFKPSKEVSEIKWLSPEDAVRKIDYDNQKELCTRFFSSKRVNRLKGFMQWMGMLFPRRQRYNRLASSLKCYRIELENRIKQNVPVKRKSEILWWTDAAYELLDQAERALRDNMVDEGWKYFHAAKRMTIFGYSKDELMFRAKEIQREAKDKLSSWRKEVVETLLDKERITADRLYKATFVLDENYTNQYFRIALLQDQFKVLCYILLLSLTAILFHLRSSNQFADLSSQAPASGKMLVAVILFGLLGGSVSAIFSLTGTTIKTKIPQQIAHNVITLARVFVGAASAVGIYILLSAGIIKDFAPSIAVVLALSFVSGFTERFVKRAIESVLG